MSNEPFSSTGPGTTALDRGDIVVLNRDMMFGIQIANVLRASGFRVVPTSTTRSFVDRLLDSTSPAVLGIVNMVALVDWELIGAMMAGDAPPPVLAFGPHVNAPLWRSARGAGVTRVVSNGDFHRDMLSLVERYAHPGPPERPTPVR